MIDEETNIDNHELILFIYEKFKSFLFLFYSDFFFLLPICIDAAIIYLNIKMKIDEACVGDAHLSCEEGHG